METQEHVIELGEVTPEQLRRMLTSAREPDVPDHGGDVSEGGDGENPRPAFIVSFVLTRPPKNHIEQDALGHALGELDCLPGTHAWICVVSGNPLNDQADDSPRTYVVLGLHASSQKDAERVVIEAVTETVPAPFEIAALSVVALMPRHSR